MMPNSESIIENIKEEIAQLTMIEKHHFRQINERFNEIERHLEEFQNEYLKTKGMLSKHKAKLESIEFTLELHTTELCNISQVRLIRLLRKIYVYKYNKWAFKKPSVFTLLKLVRHNKWCMVCFSAVCYVYFWFVHEVIWLLTLK